MWEIEYTAKREKKSQTRLIIVVVVIIANSNHGDQVREIVYTANGEKITNEDSPLRNTDQVQLVGFTTYSNRLGDDGYAIVSFQKTQHVQLILYFLEPNDTHAIHTPS